MDIKILYEDAHVLVACKPAGLAVQSANLGQPDMESRLKCYLAKKSPERVPFLGLVHRLDQPVGGLLVFAKTPRAAAKLQKEMQSDSMTKDYLAIVADGGSLADEGSLRDYIKKEGRISRVTKPGEKGAKEALLDYRVIAGKEGKRLLRISLRTGRFHQIRCQLSHAGAPILGDRKYQGAEGEHKGIALFAFHLAFKHPENGKIMAFTELPKEGWFSEFSKALESDPMLLQIKE